MNRRLSIGVAAVALTTTALVLPASSAWGRNIGGTCEVDDTNPAVWSLAGDCTTTLTIPVDNGVKLDGNGHTITAVSTSGPAAFVGPIIRSAAGGGAATLMSVTHLHIVAEGFDTATGSHVAGVLFDGAYGSVSDVTIAGVSLGTTVDNGYGIEVDNSVGAPMGTNMVRIKGGTEITGYQKAGVYVHGDVKFNLFRSRVGSRAPILSWAADGVLVADLAHGSIKETRISLNDREPSSLSSFGTGIRLQDSLRVEIRRNVISGGNADIGLNVDNDSQPTRRPTAVVECTLFQRHESVGDTDLHGIGIAQWTDPVERTKIVLTDTTFVGWNQNASMGADPHAGTAIPNTPAVTPACPPNAPTGVHALGGDHASKVRWTAGVALDYAPVSGYTVSAKAAGHPAVTKTVGSGARSTTLSGLNNTLTYMVTVTARSSGGKASDTDTLYPTKLSLVAKPSHITRGQKAVLRGTLTSLDPSAKLAQRPIFISARPVGGTWHKVTTVRTTSTGRFSLSVGPRKRTSYQASYRGHPDLASRDITRVFVSP